MLIRFQCEHCRSEIEDEGLEKTLVCPACGKETRVFTNAPRRASIEPDAVAKKIKFIRREAKQFSVLAIFLFLLGLFVAICSLFAGRDASGAAIVGAALMGMAFWFHLVAQVIHIRANTTKD